MFHLYEKGKFCETCETCRDKCEVLRACVEFVYFGDNTRLLEEVENEDVVYRKELEKWSRYNKSIMIEEYITNSWPITNTNQ